MIAQLIRWDHQADFFVTNFGAHVLERSCERKLKISLGDMEHEYISGHFIDGKTMLLILIVPA